MGAAYLLFTFFTSMITIHAATPHTATLPPCNSDIYCYGDLIDTVQKASIFTDSKTFVDMKMKENSTQILAKFNILMEKTRRKPSFDEIKEFVSENFDPAGSEFEAWTPKDWHPEPKFLQKINDRALRKFAQHLHNLWRMLGRKMKEDVILNSHLYSIIPVPNEVIVPGGRFREFYYWDSYWIIRGLLLSEMFDTVKGMLGNFVSIIDRYGFIPNGGRVYYLMRSQPPLFIPMVDSYLNYTNDFNFLRANIKFLEKEFQFWIQNRTVQVMKNNKMYTLCRYQDSSSGPRPESYREDTNSARFMKDEVKDSFYSQLKTAAESGWDFSTRWFMPADGNMKKANLTDINIKSIIPVDLNAIIYWNAKLLAKYFKILERPIEAGIYTNIANNWLEAVTEILWHPEIGSWLDYDLLNNEKRENFHPSNLSPLWTNCYDKEKENDFITRVLTYLNKSKVLGFLGGIPSSLVHSGEQWDYPNAWPPSQHILIMGLDNNKNRFAKQLALDLAERWVRSNYKAYLDTNEMFEKYDATIVGGHGGGGEYDVQLGFGWTNGVLLDLLNKYGDRIFSMTNENLTTTEPTTYNSAIISSSNLGPIMTLLLACGATLTAGCIGLVVYAKKHSPRPNKSKYIKIPCN